MLFEKSLLHEKKFRVVVVTLVTCILTCLLFTSVLDESRAVTDQLLRFLS